MKYKQLVEKFLNERSIFGKNGICLVSTEEEE